MSTAIIATICNGRSNAHPLGNNQPQAEQFALTIRPVKHQKSRARVLGNRQHVTRQEQAERFRMDQRAYALGNNHQCRPSAIASDGPESKNACARVGQLEALTTSEPFGKDHRWPPTLSR